MGMVKFFNIGSDQKLKMEIDKLFSQIQKALTNNHVVLVIAQYEQWDRQDPAGQNIQFLLSVRVASAAKDRQLAYRIYRHKEKTELLKIGPNRGKTYGKRTLLWFEKLLTEDENKALTDLQKGRNLRWESAR